MAITRQPTTIIITATNDAASAATLCIHAMLRVQKITFEGTGLTVGQRFVLRNGATAGTGDILAQYTIAATSDNANLFENQKPAYISTLSIDNTTVAGTWTITVFLDV